MAVCLSTHAYKTLTTFKRLADKNRSVCDDGSCKAPNEMLWDMKSVLFLLVWVYLFHTIKQQISISSMYVHQRMNVYQ